MKSSEHGVSGLILSQSVDTEVAQGREKKSVGVAARTDRSVNNWDPQLEHISPRPTITNSCVQCCGACVKAFEEKRRRGFL